ncbi:unnamed protein product [Cochlearia groenlandica]
MERFQGHINPYFLDPKEDVRSLEAQGFAEDESFVFKEESMQDTLSYQHMLQSEQDYSKFLSMKQQNLLKLLSLQTLKEPWEVTNQALSSQELPFSQTNMTVPSCFSSPQTANSRSKRKTSHSVPLEMSQEKRKRKKTKQSKNIEEIENQRRNHIAIERNRRRLMNEHINSLRSLLPSSYIQRGDQASIVEGAINYVKVLEQTIQSLESQKRTQQSSEETNNNHLGISSSSLWATHEEQACVPKVEVTVIQNHVRLKVECRKKQGQLLKGIISLEKLRLTVLHLNIASSSRFSVSYSFSLKMEEDCELDSADEITKAAHQIFDIQRI